MSKKLMEILGKYERYLEWKHGTVPCISTADKVELPGIDYFDKNQAHDQIMELWKECLPKKQKHIAMLSNKDLIFTGKLTEGRTVKDWIKYGFNQAITQAQKNMGG